MPRQVDPARRCLPFPAWPERDRILWETAMRGGRGRFTERGLASRLAPKSIEKAQDGYGRWLGHLAFLGELAPAEAPLRRVTEARAAAYFDTLHTLGNRDHTIVGRFAELQLALRLMLPGADVSWLMKPGGVPLRHLLTMEKRDFLVPGSAELYGWGLEMAEKALTLAGPRRRQVMLRDGVLIALLAIAGPRLRAVHAMRLGRQIGFDGREWWLSLDHDDVKTEKPHRMPLPASLAPWIERYVAVERRQLLACRVSDSFWVNWAGATLGEVGLDKRVRWWSAKRYGAAHAFGLHRFRHAIGTTAPLLLPDQPQLGAAVLGITGRVHAKHYDRGQRAAAGAAFLAGLDADKEEALELLRRMGK